MQLLNVFLCCIVNMHVLYEVLIQPSTSLISPISAKRVSLRAAEAAEVLKKAKMQSVHTLLKLPQLRWTGHVTRMPDERLPKKVLYGELQEGKRSQGGQKKRYKDTLKASLKDFNIPIDSWEQAAQDRTKWRCLINKGASQFEKRESVKLKGSVKKGKQEPKNHHQSQHSPNSHALFATDSLELKLAYTAINEHTNTHKRQIFRN